jgi:FkbM family methyltransferase
VWLLRAFLRSEATWDRFVPLKRAKGLIGKLAPLLSRIGILRPAWVRLEPGVKMLLDPSDVVSNHILASFRNRWQPYVWEALSSSLREGGVVLDVGAHIGYFTLKSAMRVGEHGRVVAFEPNPRTMETLRANVAANHAANVTIVPVACTDSETTLKFYDAAPRHNSGASSLSHANVGRQSHELTVRGRPIDEVLRELGIQRVDAMKVDVEGAELWARRGAQETLRRFHPKIVIEAIPEVLAGMDTTVEQLFSFLKQMGYTRGRELGCADWEWTVE